MKKNILIIHVTTGFGGGVGSVIRNLINYQLSLGYRVGVVYLDTIDKKQKEYLNNLNEGLIKIPYSRGKKKGPNLLWGINLNNIFNELKNKFPKYKIVFHAHNPVAVGLLNNIKDIPLLCTIHGINTSSKYFSKVSTQLILEKMVKFNKVIVGVSKATTNFYNSKINKEYIITIKNGVNTSNKEKEKFNKFTVGYVAYLDDLKGWNYLFEAYNNIREYCKKEIDLIFVGGATIETKNEIDKLIKVNNLEMNVEYLGEINNASENIIPKLNVLVLPSKSEGIPMCILEAISNGVVVIATPVGGIPEVIKNNYNGFLVDRNADLIKEKIEFLFSNKKIYEKMSCNAMESYNNNFTVDLMGKAYLQAYSKLIR